MSSDLNAALSALARSSSDLNQLTDRATEAVRRVEEKLDGFSVGIAVAVQFGGPKPQIDGNPRKTLANVELEKIESISSFYKSVSAPSITHERRILEYRRVGKEKIFRIVVRDYDNEILFWDSLPRELKLEAVTALPALIRRLRDEVNQRVSNAEGALKEIDQFLNSQAADEEGL